MKAGTSKKRKYIPVHEIFNNLPEGSQSSLPAFHALTGSDQTSFIAYHSKQTAFEVFKQHHHLVDNIGKTSDVPCQDILDCAEKFVCHIYKVPHAHSIDNARMLLFGQCKKSEALVIYPFPIIIYNCYNCNKSCLPTFYYPTVIIDLH